VTLVLAGLFVLAAVLDTAPGTLDNAVHLSFGLTGFALSRSPRAARAFLIGGAVSYIVFWQFGTVVDPTLVPFHITDATVHLALVASMIGLAVLSGGDRTAAVEVEYEYVVPEVAYVAPVRQTRNRPPGRDDRRTTRLAAARRSAAYGFAYRA
jgi:hypothetical protein